MGYWKADSLTTGGGPHSSADHSTMTQFFSTPSAVPDWDPLTRMRTTIARPVIRVRAANSATRNGVDNNLLHRTAIPNGKRKPDRIRKMSQETGNGAVKRRDGWG